MNRALIWKEFREQGVIAIALMVLGSSILVVLGLLLGPPKDNSSLERMLATPGTLGVLMFITSSGLVVGGTLFAAERENKTMAYFTLLPVPRWRLWLGKWLAGLLISSAITAVLFGTAALMGLFGPVRFLLAWGFGLFCLSLIMFGWGMVGSSLARTSLAAAAWGWLLSMLATAVVVPVLSLVAYGLSQYPIVRDLLRINLVGEGLALAAMFTLLLLPFLISLRVFTAPDRNRRQQAIFGASRQMQPIGEVGRPLAERPVSVRPQRMSWLAQHRAAWWMVFKQTRGLTLLLGALSLVFGGSFLIPGSPLIAVWPAMTLLFAILIGVLMWTDEHDNGSQRFWIERRMPVGALWFAKFAMGLCITLFCSVLAMVPLVVTMYIRESVQRGSVAAPSALMFEPYFPLLPFLFVWPVYGFAFGHLIGLLFRKAIVAIAVALMLGGTLAAVWLPSFLGGGLHQWQLWLTPLIAVLAARWLVWPFAADQVSLPRHLTRIGLVAVAALVALGVSLSVRVLEVPDVAERNRDVDFARNEIPPFETNLGGRELRKASSALLAVRLAGTNQTDRDLFVNRPQRFGIFGYYVFPRHQHRWLETVLEQGWVSPPDDVSAWSRRAFDGGWPEAIEESRKLPLGTLEDPTELNMNSPLKHLDGLQGAEALLVVRALQRQAEGNPADFVLVTKQVLAMTRTMRNKSIVACHYSAMQSELALFAGLQRWLERLVGRDDLVMAVADEWSVHEQFVNAIPPEDVSLATQVVLRNSFQFPTQLAQNAENRHVETSEAALARRQFESDLLSFAWQVPWEQERHLRLIGIGNQSRYTRYTPAETEQMQGLPYLYFFTGLGDLSNRAYGEDRMRNQHVLRAAQMLLAIRRYELKHGRVPGVLTDLVPEFLTAVPPDPYTGNSYQYRVTGNEDLRINYKRGKHGGSQIQLSEPEEAEAALAGLAVRMPQYSRQHGDTTITTEIVRLAPGRAVLWSVGDDKLDAGGTEFSPSGFGKDYVVLVSPPVEDRK